MGFGVIPERIILLVFRRTEEVEETDCKECPWLRYIFKHHDHTDWPMEFHCLFPMS